MVLQNLYSHFYIDTIVEWLKEEATKRKLPFVDMAGRLLVKRAISNAKKQQST